MNKEALEKYRAKLDKAFTQKKIKLFNEKLIHDNYVRSLAYLAIKVSLEQ